MTITYNEQRKKYCVQVTVKGHRYQGRFDTKKEAQKFEASCRLTESPESNVTLGDWLLTYLTNYKRPTVSEVTYRRYKQSAAHLAPLCRYPIKDLPSFQVQKLYNELSTKLSAESVLKVHKILKSSLMQAFALGLINKPPLMGVTKPTVHKPQIEIFTDDEIAKIKSVFTDSNMDLLFYTLMITGARPSELLALRPMAVRENSIYICENKKNLRGQVFGRTKTTAGEREIPIPLSLSKKLRTFNEFCFHTANNTAYSLRNVERAWKSLLKRADVPYKRLYTLRHTFGTRMLAEGIPVNEVARIMGHANASITLNRYGHAIKGYDDIILQKQMKIFEAI